ncbi:MAG: hypothetical protein FWB88_07815 [Defluviitaleaceae bacterium]|nr:hypothetical protein [Defluviitaleaceae bacterium]MCL2240102.1 hypothetical protein [Defluviitaleaceae bacterium]
MNRERRIKLDHLGQFYSAVNSEENPGTFSVGVHLKEPVLLPEVLQEAVNGLVKRLPHLNVRRYSGFFDYYHEMLAEPLRIEREEEGVAPCRYFAKGGPLLRVLYGKGHFTLEVHHSVCDGRSLAMVASSLLIRYCELLAGEKGVDKEGFIDCAGAARGEESEDAYARYADMRKTKSDKDERVYVPMHQPVKAQHITHTFELPVIKAKAKARGLTLTEYIMAHIFSAFKKQRELEGVEKSITCNVPIDCRTFFPSKSLRCFVSSKIIQMPESAGFHEMAHGIKKQFAEITPGYIQGRISEMERLIRLGRFVPLFIKKWIIQRIGHSVSAGCSTGFSNLGLIKLPKAVQDKVAMYSFVLGIEPDMPYQFACVATGDILTLTATITAKDTAMVERIYSALAQAGDA